MKKLLFATALLTALFLSACGSQKADSNDLANQPATRPEEGAELDPEFSVDDGVRWPLVQVKHVCWAVWQLGCVGVKNARLKANLSINLISLSQQVSR